MSKNVGGSSITLGGDVPTISSLVTETTNLGGLKI